MNTLTIFGVLMEKGEPKIFGNAGQSVMNGLIECPRQNFDGENVEPEIFEFSAFKESVGRIARIPIGTAIYAEGYVRSKTYEKDGERRLFTSIVLRSVRVV